VATTKYVGFISYSHQDRRWGEWLHRAIERYRVPARLVGTEGTHGPVPQRLFPVFRDREELSTAGALADALQRALENSRCFVLVCSPASARSRWVNEEVLQFKRLGGEQRILCLIIDGEPNATAAGRPERECFPPALRFLLGPDGQLSDIPAEPLAADAREGRDGRDVARLKIIAGLLGVSFGDLRQRDLQARSRRLGFLAALTTGVAALTIVLAVQAMLARKAAEKSRQQAEDLIGFMLGDLRSKLEPLGKLDILDAVGDKAMGYFDQLDNSNLSEAALIARAKALRQIGDVRFQQGRPEPAAAAIESALTLNRELASRHPDDLDLQFELGQTEFWVAFAALRAKQFDRAASHFEAYRAISQGLVDRDPKNPKWQLEVGYAETNLAALEDGRGRSEAELGYARKAVDLLLAIEPKTDEVRKALANAYSYQGNALQALGRAREAMAAMRPQVDLMRELALARPNDQRRKLLLGSKLSAYGFAALAANAGDQAAEISREGLAMARMLVANDPANVEYRDLLAKQLYIEAGSNMLAGRGAEAEHGFAQAAAIFGDLLSHDGSNAKARAFLLSTEALRFELALLDSDLERAQAAIQRGGQRCEVLTEVDKRDYDPVDCMRVAVRQWELAQRREPQAPEVEQARNLFERSRAVVAGTGDGERAALTALVARAMFLDGHAEQAVPMLQKLMADGFMPPDLWSFLTRHCHGDPLHITLQNCRIDRSGAQSVSVSESSQSGP